MSASTIQQTAIAVRCPVCDDERAEVVRIGVREDPDRLVYECRSCALRYLAPAGDIEQYYRGVEYRMSHNPRPGTAMTPAERFAEMRPLMGPRLRQFMGFVPRASRVLDYGCSSGFFVDALRVEGYRASGVEINDGDVAFARARGLPVAPLWVRVGGPLDAIAACHVLEHLPEPREWLSWACESLRPGGTVYIEVPNARDALLSYGIPEFEAFYYREPHLQYFTREHVERLLVEAGFEPRIEFRQEYSLANAMHWLTARGPQASAQEAQAVPRRPLLARLDAEYRRELEATGEADLIVAVGTKPGGAA